jgi:LysR family transcriptional regulator, transcriptional activator of nhaA
MIDWINYHHLLYFWTIVRTGSMTGAARELMLATPTISSQIKELEHSIGAPLFDRTGRELQLTETGQMVYSYANDIFTLGQEMMSALHNQPTNRPLRIAVGIDQAVPKLVAREIVKPALNLPRSVHLICREGSGEQHLSELAAYRLDMILSDHPLKSGSVKAYSHLLGECGVVFLAEKKLAGQLKKGFPKSLDGAPMLMPSEQTTLRSGLERFFETHQILPRVVAEFDDTALVKVFGSDGLGAFAIHDVIADEICRRYDVLPIGKADGIVERFYAIAGERKVKNSAVLAVTTAARDGLFRKSKAS